MTRIKIGDWTVRPSLNLVERDGTSVKIEPRAMDLLVYLARAKDRVVPADELLRNVWQGRVFDDGIVYKRINQLRNALGDDARGSQFIETVPKRGYRLIAPVTTDDAISVAVLPFVSITGADDEYFSDGLTDELLNRLSGVAQLRVTARGSSFYFKGKSETVQTVGRLLGVRYVLNGSVRRAGDQLRVTVQLDDAASGANVWSDQFERGSSDVFAVQDEIALAVMEHLELTLLDEARSAVTQRPTASARAQDLYYRAKHLSERFELDDLNRAIAFYEQAIAIDSRYVEAYVGLADALRVRFQVGELHPRDPSYDRACDLLRKALALDPRNADAHALLSTFVWLCYDCAGAERELRLAEQSNPDGLNVLMAGFFYYITCGWPPERLTDYGRRLQEAHPLNPYASQLLGIAYWHLHDYDAALVEFERLLERFPNYYPVRWSRYMTLEELGRYPEALEEAKRTVALYDYGDTRSFLGVAYARVGDLDSARKIYDELRGRSGKYWSQALRGVLLLAMGDRDAALDALEQARADRDWQLWPALHYKMLVPLHGDPRFEKLVDLLGQRRRVELLVACLRETADRAPTQAAADGALESAPNIPAASV